MPSGVYIRTDEARRNISLASKKQIRNNPDHLIKMQENLPRGKEHHFYGGLPEEIKKKISDKLKGRKLSEVTKKKMLGRIPWNKGVPCAEGTKEKLRQANLGKKHTDETKKKLSEKLKGRKGKPVTKETKKKIRKARAKQEPPNKGKKFPKEWRNNIGLSGKGRKHSEEEKKKRSVSLLIRYADIENRIKLSCLAQGVSREEWVGFFKPEPYCSIWTKEYRYFIKERDNYQCQNLDCKGKSNRFCVHHINYDKDFCEPWNLITLCNSCHSKTNFNRDYWQGFYFKIIEERGYKDVSL